MHSLPAQRLILSLNLFQDVLFQTVQQTKYQMDKINTLSKKKLMSCYSNFPELESSSDKILFAYTMGKN